MIGIQTESILASRSWSTVFHESGVLRAASVEIRLLHPRTRLSNSPLKPISNICPEVSGSDTPRRCDMASTAAARFCANSWLRLCGDYNVNSSQNLHWDIITYVHKKSSETKLTIFSVKKLFCNLMLTHTYCFFVCLINIQITTWYNPFYPFYSAAFVAINTILWIQGV